MGGACLGTEVRQGRVAGIVGLLALAVVLALSWMLQRPPTLVPSSAPAAVFSAHRAYSDLQLIAGPEPTPIGSAGCDAVRDHIAAALSAAGFSVEMHTGVGSRTFHSTTVAGRVHNVVATWPGYDSTYWLPITALPSVALARPTTRPQSRPCWRRHARSPAVSRCATTSS